MDINDLARSIFGTSRAGASPPSPTSTVYGTAASDSSNGSVRVYLGADVVTDDRDEGADACVEIPTTQQAHEGDTVIVTVDGTGHPVVTGVIGAGDMAAAEIDAARGDASEARDQAEAAREETRDLVTLRIESSRGVVFKNSSVSTVLSVRCYKRGREITSAADLREAMGDQTARIRWWVLREGDSSWVSLDDGSGLLSDDGFTCTVTPDDVEVKCTFKAEVLTG